jgi:glutathione S-transferase
VLELDDGRLLTQSNAILWYLAEETEFLPRDPFQRAQVGQWLFFEQERVMSRIGSARFRILTGRSPELVPARLELGRTALKMLQDHLDGRRFLVGDSCSIADVANFAYTHVAADAGYELDNYPAVAAWLERCLPFPSSSTILSPIPRTLVQARVGPSTTRDYRRDPQRCGLDVPRWAPLFVAVCAAVRPWCDLGATLSRDSKLRRRRGRVVVAGEAITRGS